MVDPDVQDWERLRKAMPAIETPKPSIDDQMKAYLDAADEEFNKSMTKTEWWKQHQIRKNRDKWDDGWGIEALKEPREYAARHEVPDDLADLKLEPYEFEEDKEDVVNGIDEAMAKSHYWADSKKEDVVNSPNHYTNGSIECIEGIQASMSEEAFAGYLKGNCLKYLWRYETKHPDDPLQDLQKAQWYLAKLLNVLVFEEGEE